MREIYEYVTGWSLVFGATLLGLALLFSFILGISASVIKFDIWKQKQIALTNIERAKGIAQANKIVGYRQNDIMYL